MPCGVPCRAAFESDKMFPAHIGQSPTHSATHRWDTLLACRHLTDSSRPQALAARKVAKQNAGGNDRPGPWAPLGARPAGDAAGPQPLVKATPSRLPRPSRPGRLARRLRLGSVEALAGVGEHCPQARTSPPGVTRMMILLKSRQSLADWQPEGRQCRRTGPMPRRQGHYSAASATSSRAPQIEAHGPGRRRRWRA